MLGDTRASSSVSKTRSDSVSSHPATSHSPSVPRPDRMQGTAEPRHPRRPAEKGEQSAPVYPPHHRQRVRVHPHPTAGGRHLGGRVRLQQLHATLLPPTGPRRLGRPFRRSAMHLHAEVLSIPHQLHHRRAAAHPARRLRPFSEGCPHYRPLGRRRRGNRTLPRKSRTEGRGNRTVNVRHHRNPRHRIPDAVRPYPSNPRQPARCQPISTSRRPKRPTPFPLLPDHHSNRPQNVVSQPRSLSDDLHVIFALRSHSDDVFRTQTAILTLRQTPIFTPINVANGIKEFSHNPIRQPLHRPLPRPERRTHHFQHHFRGRLRLSCHQRGVHLDGGAAGVQRTATPARPGAGATRRPPC